MKMTECFAPSQALARKKRKEILASQKSSKRQRLESEDDKSGDSSGFSQFSTPCPPACISKSILQKDRTNCKAKVIKSATKYQNRYVPDIAMSKEEEMVWRREARKQRNRESAANSRNKVRNRIEELENEVADWKSKYADLMERISSLEKDLVSNCTHEQLSSLVPSSPVTGTPKNIYIPSSVSSCSSGENLDLSVPLVPDLSKSNVVTSSSAVSLHELPINVQNVTNNIDLHVIDSTSRPAASS
jgi:hypothetical protein